MRKIDFSPDMAPLMPCVATVGFFDGVHLGHCHVIAQVVEEARRRGVEATVVTFAQHPRQVVDSNFIPQLLTTNEEKIVALAHTGADNCVVINFTQEIANLSAHDFMKLVLAEKLRAECLVTGYDNRFGHNREDGFEQYVAYGKEIGISVMQATPLTISDITVSSSAIRRLIQEGDVETAAKCLGRPYLIVGHVVEGFQQGRRLGFPTANICPDNASKMLPATGVYAAKVRMEESMAMKRAVVNIGVRPTFHGHTMSIEAHIINYDGNLYGRRLLVTLTKKLRDERKFNSTGELVAQMRQDVRVANSIFDKEISDNEHTD